MFEFNFYYERIRTAQNRDESSSNGNEVRRHELLAIHFGRLSGYRKKPDWNIQKILLYEYMLFCYRKYGDNFTRTYSLIEKETRLSKNSINKYLNEFEAAEYITIHRKNYKKGEDFMNRYSINFDKIMESLDQIYDFEGQSHSDIVGNVEFLEERYKYIRDHPYNRDKQNSYIVQESND